jgi:hypothetical protein
MSQKSELLNSALGIDPGRSGVFCIVKDDIPWFIEMPLNADGLDVFEIIKILKSAVFDVVTIEKPFTIPGNRNKGLHVQYEDFGTLRTLIIEHIGREKLKIVTPKQFKTFYGIGSDKQLSIKKAKELCPDIQLRRTGRCTTDSHDRAESFLLARYGMTNL